MNKNLKTFKDSNPSYQISKLRNGNYIARRSYFYRHQAPTQHEVKEVILNAIPEAVVIGTGDIDYPFCGGAPVSKQSHTYIEFSLTT